MALGTLAVQVKLKANMARNSSAGSVLARKLNHSLTVTAETLFYSACHVGRLAIFFL